MTELDGAERLDPALREVATTRTDFSLDSVQLMREPFNERRREAAEHTDTRGVQIVEDDAAAESGTVAVRIYRGGEGDPAPVIVYCHAGGFVLGNLDTDHRQCVELARRGR
ncbi:MAG TPA: alpha/beta hydrolase, partial [Mycobacterium sp.]|nr:alpha/beta hydrolase [Mycobacterium sp.]